MGRLLKKTEKKFCEFCGKEYIRKKYGKNWEDYTRWEKRKFCCRACAESKKYPTDKSTYHIRARKNIKVISCEKCGEIDNLDVHHIDRNIKNNLRENLKVYCHKCHMNIHLELRRKSATY